MILIIIALTVSCSQKGTTHQSTILAEYLDDITSISIVTLKTIGGILDADAAVLEAMLARDEEKALHSLSYELDALELAKATINSEISKYNDLSPPDEAQKLHSLVFFSLRYTQSETNMLLAGNTIIYEKFYDQLKNPTMKKDYPDTSQIMVNGRQMIQDALDTWGQAGEETDRLMESLGIK